MARSPVTVPPCEGKIISGIFSGGKTVVYLICLGMAKAIGRAAFRLDPQRIFEIERFKRCIKDMNPHVTQCAATEIKNFPPLTGVINFLGEVSNRRRAEPEIPVERLRHDRFFGEWFAIISPVLEAPYVDLLDFTDDTRGYHR